MHPTDQAKSRSSVLYLSDIGTAFDMILRFTVQKYFTLKWDQLLFQTSFIFSTWPLPCTQTSACPLPCAHFSTSSSPFTRFSLLFLNNMAYSVGIIGSISNEMLGSSSSCKTEVTQGSEVGKILKKNRKGFEQRTENDPVCSKCPIRALA